MTVANHLVELKRKHTILDDEINALTRSPGSDALKIGEMKRKKLQIKQEISRLNGK